MILIDKDKLIHSLEIIPCKDSEERATVNWIIDEIDEKPRVRAIPIEWIVNWLTKQTIPAQHTCDDYYAVEMMLEDWEKENE